MGSNQLSSARGNTSAEPVEDISSVGDGSGEQPVNIVLVDTSVRGESNDSEKRTGIGTVIKLSV